MKGILKYIGLSLVSLILILYAKTEIFAESFYGASSLTLVKIVVVYLVLIFLVLLMNRIDKDSKRLIRNKRYDELWFYVISIINLYVIVRLMFQEQFSSELERRMTYAFGYAIITVICYYTKYFPQNRFIGIRTATTLQNEYIWNEAHKMLSILVSVMFIPFIMANFLFSADYLMIILNVYILILFFTSIQYVEKLRKKTEKKKLKL